LYRLRRAADVVTAILDGNTHRSLDDWDVKAPVLGDFLKLEPLTGPRPTKIVMNPPFKAGEDAKHVLHAYDRWLVPGGILVAIMSASVEYRRGATHARIRTLAEELPGSHMEHLDEGSFAEVGTNVRTILVVLVKPAPPLR
jgi:hypothetical protein